MTVLAWPQINRSFGQGICEGKPGVAEGPPEEVFMRNTLFFLSLAAGLAAAYASSASAVPISAAAVKEAAATTMSRMLVEKAAAVAEAQFAATTAAAAGNKDYVIAGKALQVFRK